MKKSPAFTEHFHMSKNAFKSGTDNAIPKGQDRIRAMREQVVRQMTELKRLFPERFKSNG